MVVTFDWEINTPRTHSKKNVCAAVYTVDECQTKPNRFPSVAASYNVLKSPESGQRPPLRVAP